MKKRQHQQHQQRPRSRFFCIPVLFLCSSIVLKQASGVSNTDLSLNDQTDANENENENANIHLICPLEGLVEMIYNATLDEYVYRDIYVENHNDRFWWRPTEIDPDKYEQYKDDERYFTPKISAGLYRKCACRHSTNDKYAAAPFVPHNPYYNPDQDLDDDIYEYTNRYHNSSDSDSDMDTDTAPDVLTANRYTATICPLESDACDMTWDEEQNRIAVRCYIVESKIIIIRNAWPIMWLWYTLLALALFISKPGRQAIHYVLRNIGACCGILLCRCKHCFCASDDNNNNNNETPTHHFEDLGLRYNRFLVDRTMRQELRQREVRRERIDRLILQNGRERTIPDMDNMEAQERRASSRTPQDPDSSGNERNDSNNDHVVETRMHNGMGPQSPPLALSPDGTLRAPTTYAYLQQEYGIRKLALKTKRYKGPNTSNRDGSACNSFLVRSGSHLSERIPSKHDGQLDTTVCSSASEDERCTNSKEEREQTDDDNDNNELVDSGGLGLDNGSGGDGYENDEETCIICFGIFQEGDKVGDLPYCDHLYHAACLKTWIARKNTCPMCMKPMATVHVSS